MNDQDYETVPPEHRAEYEEYLRSIDIPYTDRDANLFLAQLAALDAVYAAMERNRIIAIDEFSTPMRAADLSVVVCSLECAATLTRELADHANEAAVRA